MQKPIPIVNPFAPPKVDASAPRVRWGIAASGPPVDPSEVETHERAAEVVMMWGDDVLHVAHVSPPRDVVIGEPGEGVTTDYLVGRELLGRDRLPVVVERDGQLCCVIPDGASAEVTIGSAKKSLAELALVPFASLPGAQLYPLPEGASARVEHRGLTFVVRPTAAARAIGAPAPKLKHTGWIGLSLAVHAVFLVMFYFMPPRSSALSLDDVTSRDPLVEYLVESPEVVEEPVELYPSPLEAGEAGQRHDGEEGQAGDPEERPTRNRLGVAGNPDDPSPQMARERLPDSMDDVAAIGALRRLVGNWNAPTSPYGANQPHGRDSMNALGALLGDQVGPNFGGLGLGMRGTGRGAGGLGQGTIGLGMLGTIGTTCGGERCGDGTGYGRSVDLPRRDHVSDVPTIRIPRPEIMGQLSQEAIRRVVQRHLPEVRFCYEQGLQANPSLEGRVTVSWIIDGGGRVQSSSLASSSVSNGEVEQCIVRAVQRWTFPAPENGGVVGVNYPFVLQTNQ